MPGDVPPPPRIPATGTPSGLPDGLLLSFYGDDFTGSTDVMEALTRVGLRTVLFLSPPGPEDLRRFTGVRAVGVAGISRGLSLGEMDRELPPIFTRLRALNAPLFHCKICSTFDSAPSVGSIGRMIDLGQEVFHSPFVPLVVGAPALNRFCVFGNLFARSGPESDIFRLDRHPTMRHHPVTPMDESDLRMHLAQQTDRAIGLVDVLQLARGPEHVSACLERLQAEGHGIVLFDLLTEAHLAAIGRQMWRMADTDAPLFAVGSSGVEYALVAHWQENGWLPAPPRFAASPADRIIVVSGSCSPVTARQIAHAGARGFVDIPLDAAGLVREGDGALEMERAVRAVLAALKEGRSVIAHICQGPDDPRLSRIRECASGLQEAALARRTLGSALGRILRESLLASDVRRVVVAGGDTSGSVAQALGLRALEMVAPFAPGSPLCRAYAEHPRLDGLEILFKGGQVGAADLFSSVLQGPR